MPIYLTLQPTGDAARDVTITSGGLLPHLFTLTGTGPAVVFCHLIREVTPAFPLRSVALCVARTFLSTRPIPREEPQRATSRHTDINLTSGCKGTKKREQNKKNLVFFYAECRVA